MISLILCVSTPGQATNPTPWDGLAIITSQGMGRLSCFPLSPNAELDRGFVSFVEFNSKSSLIGVIDLKSFPLLFFVNPPFF